MNVDKGGTPGEKGARGEQGPAGPQGPAGQAPPVEPVPPGYQKAAAFLRDHPGLRGPSMVTIVLWLVILVGGGIYLLSVSRAQDAVAHVHNISACTLRSYLTSVRTRQEQTAHDKTLSAPARKRALDSIQGIDVLLSSQVTTPANFNCTRLLADLARKHPQVRTK